MSLGDYIRTVRHRRGLSQWELSRLSGLTRSHVSRLELDDFEHPSAETFLALAKALKVHPNDLYQAAGYLEGNLRFRRFPNKSPEEAFSEMEAISLKPVPVLDIINARVSDVLHYNQNQCVEGNTTVVGLLVRGFGLEPDVKESDIIFVDKEKQPLPGNVVLCYHDEKVQLKYYRNNTGSNGTTNEGLHIYGVVIGLNRSLN